MVVAVAEESRGADHARPWIEQAKSGYWQLIDTEHRLSDLYNLVNVPQAVWIDEQGNIARPPETATGWTLKPEGMCRADACVPLLASALKPNEVDVAAFWQKLGGPVVASEQRDVWALGAPADERNAALEGLQAPDFTLPDIDGVPRTLSQLRGKKVFLATWASW